MKILKHTALLACVFAASACSANDAIVRTYETPNGDGIASISVRLDQQVAPRQLVDHVVLIDTSASQVGDHRQLSFDVLQSFLQTLPADHRAMVIAVDTQVVEMSQGFDSPATVATIALENLQARFPAGASDLGQGIDAALSALSQSENGSVTYIGDGMSAAQLIQVKDLQTRIDHLIERQIPVHAFAVGSNMDLQLLGILGQQTGGFVMQDEVGSNSLNGAQAGKMLAHTATQTVVYPQEITVSVNDIQLLPNRPLPLRSDRDTVYLLKGDITPQTELTIDSLTWNLETERTQGNTFLNTLWQQSEASNGLTLGLAADWMVSLAQETFERRVAQLQNQGIDALNQGNPATAEKIGFQIQSLDPNNVNARELIQQAGEAQLTQTVQFEGSVQEDDPLAGRENPRTDDAVAEFQQLMEVMTQRLRREVEMQIEQARSILEEDPDVAEDLLTQSRGAVKAARNIDAEVRAELLRRLADEIQNVTSQRAVIIQRITERSKRESENEAQQRLIDFASERDRQLEQMVERVRALILQGYEGDADAFEQAEAVGRQVLSSYPGSSMGVSVVFVSEAAGQIDKAERLRYLRSDRFLGTLHQTELAHVPFPDEPPVRYPPAEVWAALTQIREKWKSVDLRSNKPNELKIYDALDQITSFEFPGNPLTDVVEFIKAQHNIPIIFDDAALSEEGVSPDEDVELVISGISLESALKLLLEPLNLTYVIEDEVMKITTTFKAEDPTSMKIRVYSVGDLVMPIPLPVSGGIGGGLGGGQGGGGLGGGGFGGGGLGGGGGGGIFSVPADPVGGKKNPILK